MLEKWLIHEPMLQGKQIDPVGCILCLPGRGIPGSLMEKFLHHTALWRSLQVILEPEYYQWYPAPNGPDDQTAAVQGQEEAREVIEKAVARIGRGWGVKKDKIVLMGFSAGGVMSIYTAAHSDTPYAGVLSLAGAILEPATFPKSKHKTPIMLQHNMDDDCFKWHERYLPMKNRLIDGGYNVNFEEAFEGGHNLTHAEVKLTRKFVSEIFGYSKDFERYDDEEEENTEERSEEAE